MLRLKVFVAYTLAVLMVLVAMVTFIGMNFFATKLVSTTGIKISPWFTGGEVEQVIDHGQYRTMIHRPVFDGLLGQKKEGFIQIDWEPLAALPDKIDEVIAFKNKSVANFHISLDCQAAAAALTPYNPQVISLEGCYRLKNRLVVRVLLRRD